ncbi:MAG: hypothetical protein PHX18_08930 [Candidatus Gastranaerophilales bacterium]|nr:hypothetical protein [Candidatus Gastranaerophilales bacterium]
MDKVSELLKEAKPLYFREKRKKKQLAAACAVLVVFLGFGIFTAQEYFSNSSSDIISYQNSSIIEEMGLPTDEYGLLKAD